MPKPLYVCVLCGERFSRFSNGKRHNLNLHSNNAEIVSWTEYLVGRSTNRYQPTQPSPSRRGRYNSYRTAIAGNVADTMGDTFPQMFVGMQGQGQLHQPQYQYPTSPQQQQQQQYQSTQPRISISQCLEVIDQLFQSHPQSRQQQPTSIPQPRPSSEPLPQSQPQPESIPTATKNEWSLSSESILKLAELKSRLYANSDKFPNFDIIYQGAKHFAVNGDLSFLEEKLAFFRNFDTFNVSLRGKQSYSQPSQSNVVF